MTTSCVCPAASTTHAPFTDGTAPGHSISTRNSGEGVGLATVVPSYREGAEDTDAC